MLRHDLADSCVTWRSIVGDGACNHVPVGAHSDQAIILATGKASMLSARILAAASRIVVLGSDHFGPRVIIS